MKDNKQLQLLEPHHWLTNSPDLNSVDFGIWGILKQNVYRGQQITDIDSLIEAIVQEWNKILQEILINILTHLKVGISSDLIINNPHRYILIYICKIWYDFDWLKKVITISVNGSFFFFAHLCRIRRFQLEIPLGTWSGLGAQGCFKAAINLHVKNRIEIVVNVEFSTVVQLWPSGSQVKIKKINCNESNFLKY